MANNVSKYVASSKRGKQKLPDWLYRYGTCLTLVFVVALVQPGFFSMIPGWKLLVMIAVLILYVELSVLIKKYERSNSTVDDLIQAIIAPVLLCLLVSIWGFDIMPWMIGVGRVLLIYCVALGVLTLYVQIQAKDIQFTLRVLAYCGNILRLSVIMIMVGSIVYLSITNSGPLHIGNQVAEYETWSPNRTINANYDDLKILNNEEAFSEINSKEKRLALFATIVDVESNHLGIPHRLKVQEDVLDDDVHAAYTELKRTITINEDYLTSCTAEEMITTAAHEARHAYQHQLINTYLKAKSYNDRETATFLENNNVRKFAAEFTDYDDGEKDYYSYSSQFCERDARDYANKSCQEWKNNLSYNAELESNGIIIQESEDRLYPYER